MTIEELIFDRLSSDATLSAIVGDRIYPDYSDVPVDAQGLPEIDDYVVVQMESEEDEEQAGYIGSTVNHETATFSFAVVSSDAKRKAAGTEAIKSTLRSMPIGAETEDPRIVTSAMTNHRDEPDDLLQFKKLRRRVLYWEFRLVR